MYKIVAFTGVGISKPSGVPTFVELGDLREKLSRDYYNANPKDFFKVLIGMKNTIDKAQPNPAHKALAKYKVPIITMNIDGLHNKAGSTDVIEIHGNLDFVYCPKCRNKHDFDVVRQSIYCPICKVVYDSNVVLYGDSIALYEDAYRLISQADVLLVIGTSFYTSTASNVVYFANQSGIKVTIINDSAVVKVPFYLKEHL